MTITDTTVRQEYSSGTVLAFNHPVFAETDLSVYLRNDDGTITTLTDPANFSVSVEGDYSAAEVTLVVAIAADETCVVIRSQPLTQDIDLQESGAFPVETVEHQLDKNVMQMQYVNERVARCVRLVEAGDSTFDPELPSPITANGALVANATGDGWSWATTDPLTILVDSVDGTHIQDDSLDSEHYVDGSVDNVHLAGGITNAKLAGSIADAKLSFPFEPGMIMHWHLPTPPTGWLECDGSAVDKTTYALLWTAMGEAHIWGADPGGDDFLLPDATGRVLAGVEGTATRLTAAGCGFDGDAIGNAGGTETHVLTEAELAEHNHAGGTANTTQATAYTGYNCYYNRADTENAGSDNAHQNTQPTLVCTTIIYAGV